MALKFKSETFEQEVLNSDIPVLVDFYADWCGPCKMMGPIVDQLAEQYEGKIKIGKINIDDNSQIAAKYNVMSIPTFIFFKDGKAVETIVGGVSKDKLMNKLDQLG